MVVGAADQGSLLQRSTSVSSSSSSAGGGFSLSLDTCKATSGPASLQVSGCIIGPSQDAQLEVKDFPLTLLQPLFRALPALQVGWLGFRVVCVKVWGGGSALWLSIGSLLAGSVI